MTNLTVEEKKTLLEIAEQSILYGFQHRKPLVVDLNNCPAGLRELGATFVTLELNGALRGCIGSLLAHRPLAVDVAENAYSAAFHDPRFMPLTKEEYPFLSKHISILSKPEPMFFTSEEDLLQQIRPNIDGLILSEYGYCGTFLPSVWESLSDKKEFLAHLKMKAGLPPDYWSDTLRVERYTADLI